MESSTRTMNGNTTSTTTISSSSSSAAAAAASSPLEGGSSSTTTTTTTTTTKTTTGGGSSSSSHKNSAPATSEKDAGHSSIQPPPRKALKIDTSVLNGNGNINGNNPTTTTTATTTTKSMARSPKVSNSSNNKNNNSSSSSSTPTPMAVTTPNPTTSSSSSSSNQDNHPFARGAVIEVWHIPKKTTSEKKKNNNDDDDDDDDWWSDPETDEEVEEDDDHDDKEEDNKDDSAMAVEQQKQQQQQQKQQQKQQQQQKQSQTQPQRRSVRLCDVIDRTQLTNSNGQKEWRYYVHYRDFNRRMDEWIPISRIVSPPSIGNAKAKALKKEEERQKRKHQQLLAKQQQQKQQHKSEFVDWNAPRTSRRRTSTLGQNQNANVNTTTNTNANHNNNNTTTGSSNTSATGIHRDSSKGGGGGSKNNNNNNAVADATEEASGRRTRHSRRKSTVIDKDDDATVVATNHSGSGTGTGTGGTGPNSLHHSSHHSNHSGAANDKGGDNDFNSSHMDFGSFQHDKKNMVLALPTDAVTTQTVGEHVVATVKAQELDEHEGMDEASLREHEEVTKVKNVAYMELGPYQMETWYFSPLPKELLGPSNFLEVLYVCEFTLRMFARKSELTRHQARLDPSQRHPPGNEIYRKGNLAMFEVDGQEESIYAQNLCYIAKLFLDHKTLFYDTAVFLFYVLCEIDERGFHPVGYYSKEKYSDVGYNLACILTFPAHQRKGYGRFLIAFSYELSKKEEKVGSPEKPMSDLGQQAYKPYWASTIVDFLLNQSDESAMSIMDIAKKTSIMAEDIVFTLNQLGLLKIINGVYFIAAEESLLRGMAQKYPVKEPRVDPTRLHWTPYLTDVKRDKFSIHSKKASVAPEEVRPATSHGNH